MPAPFQPDLGALRFYLTEVAQLPTLLQLPFYRSITADLSEAVLSEAAKFASQVLSPLNNSGDTQGSKRLSDGSVQTPDGFADAYSQFVDMGWNAAGVPAEVGGQGLPCILQVAMSEMWHGANMAFSLCPLLTQGAIDLLMNHGTVEQRRLYLNQLVSGEWTGTMAMTEPQAGSDVGAVRTQAILQDDGSYRISGTKIFITYGEHDMAANIIHFVLARLPDAPAGVKGLSLFLVPKFLVEADGSIGERNEVQCLSLEHKLGIHGSPTAVMEFGGTHGAEGYLIGQANGGLNAMFTMMNAARLNVGVQGLGVAAYATQLATTYAYERVQGRTVGSSTPSAIVQHPDVTRMVLSMDVDVHSLRAMAFYTARLMDLSRAHPDAATRAMATDMVDVLIPIVKAHTTNRAFEVCNTAVQVFGGAGYIEETGIAQLLRDVRISSIYEGTNGIQALDLAMRKVRLQQGEVLRALLSEITEFAQSLQNNESTVHQRQGQSLLDAARQLELASIWLLQKHKNAETAPEGILAVQSHASLYLELFGDVLQAYLLFVSASRAHSTGNTAFAAAALNRAEFFRKQRMPYITAKAQIIIGHTE